MTIGVKSKMSLKLSKVDYGDIETIRSWRNSDNIKKYMYTNKIISREDQKKWFEKISNNSSEKYWIIEIDNIKIGLISLNNIDVFNYKCSWAYYIADLSFRGRGIAKTLECNIYDYCFFELGLNKVYCEVIESNNNVIEIHKKFGCEIEANYKDHFFKDNEFQNAVSLAITKAKWIEIKKQFKYDVIEIEN